MARVPEININWRVNFAGNVNDEPRDGESSVARELRRDLEFNTRLQGIVTQDAAVARQNGEEPMPISAQAFERMLRDTAPDLTAADIAEINRRITRESLSPSAVQDIVQRRQRDRQAEREEQATGQRENFTLEDLRPVFNGSQGRWFQFLRQCTDAARGPGPHVTVAIRPWTDPGASYVYVRFDVDAADDTPLPQRQIYCYTRHEREDRDGNLVFEEVRWTPPAPEPPPEITRAAERAALNALGLHDRAVASDYARPMLPVPPQDPYTGELLFQTPGLVIHDDPVQPSEPEDVEARPARRMRR